LSLIINLIHLVSTFLILRIKLGTVVNIIEHRLLIHPILILFWTYKLASIVIYLIIILIFILILIYRSLMKGISIWCIFTSIRRIKWFIEIHIRIWIGIEVSIYIWQVSRLNLLIYVLVLKFIHVYSYLSLILILILIYMLWIKFRLVFKLYWRFRN